MCCIDWVLEIIKSDEKPTFSPMGDCSRFYDKWTRGRPSKKSLARRKLYKECKSKIQHKYKQRKLD